MGHNIEKNQNLAGFSSSGIILPPEKPTMACEKIDGK